MRSARRRALPVVPDPIGLQGGLNPYVYVMNDPVNSVDPSGLAQGLLGASEGANGFGHSAGLLQHPYTRNWLYYTAGAEAGSAFKAALVGVRGGVFIADTYTTDYEAALEIARACHQLSHATDAAK